MDRLQDLVQKTIQQKGLHKHVVAAEVVHTAQKWLDEMFTEDTPRAMRYRNGILQIDCNHSVCVQECYSKKLQLVDHLQSLGFFVEDIRVQRSKLKT